MARLIQQAMGFISTKDLLKAIDNNVIKNCATTRRDVRIAKDIYGPDQPSIKGKTKRRGVEHVREDKICDVPEHIIKTYPNKE